MSQYRTGTVSVTTGDATVTGSGTTWLANLAAGAVFTVIGSRVPYVVASITDDTHLELTAPYTGLSYSGLAYAVTTSFTPELGIPYVEAGDVDTATVLKRSMLTIESLLDPAMARAVTAWFPTYGATFGDISTAGRAAMYSALSAAWDSAIDNGHDLHTPAGLYDIGENYFPWRNTSSVSLLDCQDITIYADGPQTIFKTVSVGGYDVLQFNCIENLSVLNFPTVTAEITGNDSGCNACSVTGGWNKLRIELSVDNLPSLDTYLFTVSVNTPVIGGSYTNNGSTFICAGTSGTLPTLIMRAHRTAGSALPAASGTLTSTGANPALTFTTWSAYVDGGKALTLQPGSTLKHGSLSARIRGVGCAYGFDYEPDLVHASTEPASIDVHLEVVDCYRAVVIGSAPASGALPANMHSGVRVYGTAVDCQRDVILGRVHGCDVDLTLSDSGKTAAAKRLDPNGVAWCASDTIVDALDSQYAKHANISIHGNKGATDYKAQIGGATAGSSGLNGATEFSDINLDISGTSAIADLLEIVSGGNSLRSSRLTLTSATASSIPSGFYDPTRYNEIDYIGAAGNSQINGNVRYPPVTEFRFWGTTHNGTKVIDGIGDTSFLTAGMTLSGSGITAGTKITTVDSGVQITTDTNSSASATVVLAVVGTTLSANANTHDDYWEGSWTPVLMDSSANPDPASESKTTSAAVGYVTFDGDMVHLNLTLTMTSIGTLTTTDPAYISLGTKNFQLPPPLNASGNVWPLRVGKASGLNLTAGDIVNAYIGPNDAYITLEKWAAAGTTGTTALKISEVSASGSLSISGSYKKASSM